jgi:outer membrane protein assembly factor BamB
MSLARICRLVTAHIIVVVMSLATASAATFNGIVEEVSVDENSVTIKTTGKKAESVTFNLAPNAAIMIDGKKGKLDGVTEGQTAIVVVNPSDLVTKLTLKTPKMPVAKKVAPKRSSDDDSTMVEGDFWPQFRGPNRDNISLEKGLLEKWPEGGPKVAWQQSGLGDGYSSVSISHGKLYTMGNQGDNEVVLAFDDSTGKPLWSTKTGGQAYREGQGNGPRGTPTVDDDRVYALGASGDLVCVGADKGEVVWQKNILNEYGGNNIVWGISESVLIDGNNLICTPGGREATMVAIDKMTGRNVWSSHVDGSPQAAYSSPIVVEYQGDRFYVNFIHSAVIAIRAKDGHLLWGNKESANETANCSTPLYSDGLIFTASGYGRGAAMFRLNKGGMPKLGYTSKEMVNHHGGMVLLDGYVYGFDEQILKCIDLKTGKPVWKDRSVGKGSLTYADNHLYLRGENGKVALCLASTKGYEETGRFEPPNRGERPAWAHPVVCGGKLYLRDLDSLIVYDVKKK